MTLERRIKPFCMVTSPCKHAAKLQRDPACSASLSCVRCVLRLQPCDQPHFASVCCACRDTPVGQPKVVTGPKQKAGATALINPVCGSSSTAQPAIAQLPNSHRALSFGDPSQAASGAAEPGQEQAQDG